MPQEASVSPKDFIRRKLKRRYAVHRTLKGKPIRCAFSAHRLTNFNAPPPGEVGDTAGWKNCATTG
jgi:hypothetical protein